MQGGWSNADSDWQLKRLQHDSVKTVEKAVQSMRGVLQEDIIAHGQEYEKMFGKSSAQYNEYLNMVMEKLEQLGVAPKQVIEWLNQTASEGTVPVSQYGTDRDSQSETIPQIRAEPIPFDQQLQPQADFDSFARLEAAASQALAVGTAQSVISPAAPSSALPFSAFPSSQMPAPLPTPTSFPSSQMESQPPAHMAAQAPAPIAQPSFQSSLLSNSAAWGTPTPGQSLVKPAAVAEAWGLGNASEAEVSVVAKSSTWGQPTEAPAETSAAKISSSWGNSEPSNNSLKSALGLAASPVVPSTVTRPEAAATATDDFNHETTWSAVPASELISVPTQSTAESKTLTPAAKVASSWDAEPEPVASNAPHIPAWNAAPAPPQVPAWSAAPAPSQEPAWNVAPSAPPVAAWNASPTAASAATPFVAPIAAIDPAPSPTPAQNAVTSQAFTQWGAPTSVQPQIKPANTVDSPWVTAAATPSPVQTVVAESGPSVSGWAMPTSNAAPTATPATATPATATPATATKESLQAPASLPIPAPVTAPTQAASPSQTSNLPGWPSPVPASPVATAPAATTTGAPAPASLLQVSETPWTAAANSLAIESQWAAPSIPIPSPTLGPGLTPPAITPGPMMAPISKPAPLPQAPAPLPIAAPVQALAATTTSSPWGAVPTPTAVPIPVSTPIPTPIPARVAAPLATPPSPWGAVPAPVPVPVPVSAPASPSSPATAPVSAPMQAVAPVVSVAPVIPVAMQMPANDQSASNQSTRPSFGGWPAGPMPNPYATQDALQKPNQQQQLPLSAQQQQIQQPLAQPASAQGSHGWTQQPMQNSPIATPQYQNTPYGNGTNGGNGGGNFQVQRQEEREEPNYDPATAWD